MVNRFANLNSIYIFRILGNRNCEIEIAKMSNASVHNLAQEGKIDEILVHLKEKPSDLNLKNQVSRFSFSICKLTHFFFLYNILLLWPVTILILLSEWRKFKFYYFIVYNILYMFINCFYLSHKWYWVILLRKNAW